MGDGERPQSQKHLQPKYNQDHLQLHEQHQTDHRQLQQTRFKFTPTHP